MLQRSSGGRLKTEDRLEPEKKSVPHILMQYSQPLKHDQQKVKAQTLTCRGVALAQSRWVQRFQRSSTAGPQGAVVVAVSAATVASLVCIQHRLVRTGAADVLDSHDK